MKFLARRNLLAAGAASLMLAAVSAAPAKAEVGVVNLSQQFGLLYVPLHVVLEHKLIEKNAKALGLTPPEIKLFKISGAANNTKALLSKTVDFASIGIGGVIKLWAKSDGAFKVARGIADMPLKLITNDPKIQKIEDYLTIEDHKIATPAAKVSVQAVVLQIYTEKLWGDPVKLDHLVVSMKHPTAYAAIVSGGQSVRSHFATLPYSYQELQSGKARTIVTSYDIMGGQHSVLLMMAGQEFKDKNPKTYRAVTAAFDEALAWVNANPLEAAELYIKYTKTKLDPELVKAMLTDKNEVAFDATPKHTMVFANFLHKIGDLPKKPNSWKDFYFEDNHHLNGS